MPFEYIPLLHHLGALYQMPRNMERFKTYVASFLNEQGDDVDIPPLVIANPMAKEHVLTYVQQLMAIDAEITAEAVTKEAEGKLPQANLKVSLMVLDDSKGGWTNRHTTLIGLWGLDERGLNRWRHSAWVTVPCWTSDPPSASYIRQQTLIALYQAVWAMTRPLPKTLREILRFEGAALAFAGVGQWMDTEELEYTRAVLEPHMNSLHYPTLLVALGGDIVAQSLGYEPLGLSPKAGLALGLANALVAPSSDTAFVG